MEFNKVFPILKWGKNYNKSFLRADVIAGITIGAFTIPEAIAYSSLAGLPPQAGLYAALAGLLVYFIFGTSKQLSIGPTSALAILIGSVIGTMAIATPENYMFIASLVALLAGIFAVVAWGFKLGFIVKFISRTVLTGFLTGAAFYIAISQIGRLFGIEGASGKFLDRLIFILQHLNETHLIALTVGIIGIAFLVIMEKKFPKLPSTLILVVSSIVIFTIVNPAQLGIVTVGFIPPGLPNVVIPDISIITGVDWYAIVILALACFLLAYIEGMGIAKTLALKNEYKINENQELLALGATNIFSGLIQGFPIGGSISRSAVNDDSGAKTPLAGLFGGFIIIFTVLLLTEFFTNLPDTILAAIILVIAARLVHIGALKRIYYLSKREFVYAIATFLGVLTFGILEGILIGIAISFLDVLYKIYNPSIVKLGRVPETNLYKNIEYHPENEETPGILVFRVDSAQLFVNIENIRDNILEIIAKENSILRTTKGNINKVSLVVFSMENTDYLDITAVEILEELHDILAKKGIEFRLAEFTGPVRDMLRKIGFAKDLGLGEDDYVTVDEVIKDWEKNKDK